MAFEIILPPSRAGKVVKTGVTVAIRKSLKVSQGFVVTLGTDVLEKTGWAKGDAIQPRYGTGSDLGMLLLTKADAGYTLRFLGDAKKTKSHRLSLAFPRWAGVPDEARRAVMCAWEARPEGLLIRLPAWAGRSQPIPEPVRQKLAPPAAKPYPAFS